MYRDECSPDFAPSCQMASQVEVRDGALQVHMDRLQYPRYMKDKLVRYAGGGLITREPLPFGYFEARIKSWAYPGFWQSFWAATANSIDKTKCAVCNNTDHPRQEIDVFEINSGVNSYQYNHIKWWPPPRMYVAGRRLHPGWRLTDDWHVWGLEHTPIQSRVFLDGEVVGTGDWSALKIQELMPMHYWLSAIITEHITHCMSESNLPGTLKVDYFRVYRPNDGVRFSFGPLGERDAWAQEGSTPVRDPMYYPMTDNNAPPPPPSFSHPFSPRSCPLPLSAVNPSFSRLHEMTIALWVRHDPTPDRLEYLSYTRADEPALVSIGIAATGPHLMVTLDGNDVQFARFWEAKTSREREDSCCPANDFLSPFGSSDEGGGRHSGWVHLALSWRAIDGRLVAYRDAEQVQEINFMAGGSLPRDAKLHLGRRHSDLSALELANVKLFSSELPPRDISATFFCLANYGDLADSQLDSSEKSFHVSGSRRVGRFDDAQCPKASDTHVPQYFDETINIIVTEGESDIDAGSSKVPSGGDEAVGGRNSSEGPLPILNCLGQPPDW
mmetsp:Transcript_457/g.1332  ORF Transcript_457/g.1332 Transcript_457/m.1332 type:complete len:555 (-) Transcript_457:332-1996(-)